MNEATPLHGRVALVTAASRGIGFGAAAALARAGARVAICARGQETLETARNKLAGEVGPQNVFALAGDIGDGEFLARLVGDVQTTFGADIDILINNNGGPPAGDTLSRSESEWSDAIARNLMSVVRLCALIAPSLQKRGWGRIINLTSLTAKEPSSDMVLSSVTRAGVSAYSKTLARELAPSGITVNVILTGACLTERLIGFAREDMKVSGETLDQVLQRTAAGIPAGFIPTPDEFAQVILFLASQNASFLTGLSIPVDGGASHSVF
jgi:3-oxoacyl-[acyl-carrier protein] reductase